MKAIHPGARWLLVPAVVLTAFASLRAAAAEQQPSPAPRADTRPAADAASAQHATLQRYCFACHNDRTKAGDLVLDGLDVGRAAEHADVWEKVVRKLRAGLMPPAGSPRPDAAAHARLVGWLEIELDRAALAKPNPGRTEPFHRLNRAEYRNVIRDLLALDIDVASVLPADDASYGFDNIAGVLKVNQPQIEQYLAAARKISRLALARSLAGPTVEEFRVPETRSQEDHIDGLPLGTRGGLLVTHYFPQDGDYEIGVDLLCRMHGECDGAAGYADTHELEVTVDGQRAKVFVFPPRKETELRPADQRRSRVRVPLSAGPHEIAAAFIKLPSVREADTRIKRFLKPHYLTGNVGDASQAISQPYVDRVTMTGPFNPRPASATPSRRAILRCQPVREAEEAPCARKIATALARRAYRRPVTTADIDPLLRFYDEGRRQGGFEGGIEAALRRLLVSPEFLFRIERDPAKVARGANYRVSDLELASRLSFFLWSSIPDDELLNAAAAGRLRNPTVFDGQVRRMLGDARSKALVVNFAGQWLQLRNLDAVRMDSQLYPNFDDGLRLAFRRETELFVESILREDRGVMELLTADYTFVNERLARHYGIRGVYDDRFRRVTLTDPRRGGLLGHGSVLTVTSRPNRTSPVLRGKWILNTVLGTPPPEPPADVPALEEEPDGNHNQAQTVRERLAAHRKNPGCAGCHAMIDPPGFALENFDAIGRWRDVDDAFRPIDASGAMPDGAKFDGLASFRAMLLGDPRRFATAVTEKLMIYALGRGLEPYDMPAIRRIVRDTAPGYRLSAIIVGVTRSVPFQMRRAAIAGNER